MTAFVVSDVLGRKAGAYLATWLLFRELARLGLKVTCFARHESWAGQESTDQFEVVRPWLLKGCRRDWPGQCLAWQASRRIRREQPNLVFVAGVTLLARYLLKSASANQLLIWELTNANPGNKFVDREAARLLSRCRGLLSPSKAIDQHIRRTYGYQGPILRLPFWVEDESEKQKAESRKQKWDSGTMGLRDNGFAADFIFLGRRDSEKGLSELIKATAIVAGEYPAVNVLICGAGDEKPFETLARELGVSQNVTLRFFSTRIEAMDVLSRSRCLVLPSYHEGYPLVLLEAAQHGVPVIATTVGSIPELLNGSKAAILVPPRDVSSLAGAMLRILRESPHDYEQRCRTALDLFGRVSSAEVVATRLRNLLAQLKENSAA